MNSELAAKRLGLLRELVPKAAHTTVLANLANAPAQAFVKDLQAGAASLGVSVDVIRAGSDTEIDAAFAVLAQKPGGVLLIATDSFFYVHRAKLAALAARHAIPTIYDNRDYAEAGGLISYGPDLGDAFEQTGAYVARVLKGEKPADLPVMQSTRMEMILNVKAAKALRLEIPDRVLALADDVIE